MSQLIADTPAAPRSSDRLGPLRDPTYRRLFAAQVVSLVGTGMTTVALGLLAYKLSAANAGTILGVAFGLKMVAYVGVAPLAAAFAHRVSRRTLLIGLDLVRALVIGALAFVGSIWEVFALVFVVNACSAAFTPAFQALIPVVLTDEDQYTQALSLSRIAYELEGLLSPVLAAIVLAVISLNALFVADVASFLISAGLVMTLVLPAAGAGKIGERTWRRITGGIRKYMKVPRLRGLLALDFAVACASAMVIVNTVVFVRSSFHLSASSVAWALGVAGGGSMLGAFAVPGLIRRFSERTSMLGGGFLLVLGLVMTGFSSDYVELLVAWFALGIGLAVVQTPSGRLIQRSVTGDDGAELFAAQFSLSHACWLISYPAAGVMGSTLGLEATAFAFGLAAAGSVLLASLLWRGG